jgi:hypothetical protein
MATLNVTYRSSTLLSCRCEEDAEVIICLDPALTSTGAPFINGNLTSAISSADVCGNTSYSYYLTYTDTDLADPATAIISSQIEGVLCRGCLTDYIDYWIGGGDLPNFYFITNEQQLIDFQTAPGSQGIVIASFALTQNVICVKPLFIVENNQITCTGQVLTFNGQFNAGEYHCFNATGTEVVFGNGSTLEVLPEWFGATGDGVTDDTDAIQTALYSASVAYLRVTPLARKIYKITSTITLPERANFGTENIGSGCPIIRADDAITMFKCADPAGLHSHIMIKGLYFWAFNVNIIVLDTNAHSWLNVQECTFIQGRVHIDMRAGGIWNTFKHNSFTSADFAGIWVCGTTVALHILENTFVGQLGFLMPYGIRFEKVEGVNLLNEHSVSICENIFTNTGGTSYIYLEPRPGTTNYNFVVSRNDFDGTTLGPMIDLKDDSTATITNNSLAGGALQVHLIECSGFRTDISDNFLAGCGAGSAIHLTGLAQLCHVGLQKYILSPPGQLLEPVIEDDGLTNIVDREDEYAQIIIVATEQELIDAAAGPKQNVIVNAPITLTAGINIYKPLEIRAGCSITTDGFNLNIHYAFKAGKYQCFIAAPGEVQFLSHNCSDGVNPEWFGAVGDGIVDDTDALQCALDATSVYHHIVRLSTGRQYAISTLNVPTRASLIADGIGGAGCLLKSNAAAPMLVLPSPGATDAQIRITGLQIQGLSTATAGIVVNGNSFVSIERCQIVNCVIGIDHSGGGTHNNIIENQISGNTTGLKITGTISNVLVQKNYFDSTLVNPVTNSVLTDNTTLGSTLEILDNYFGATGSADVISLDAAGGYQGFFGVIARNYFFGNASSSFITIASTVMSLFIDENAFRGTSNNHIICDGSQVTIQKNMFMASAAAAISFLAGSNDCLTGPQQWGAGGLLCAAEYLDIGTNNIRFDPTKNLANALLYTDAGKNLATSTKVSYNAVNDNFLLASKTTLTPSAAQVIDAVGDAILANATVVVLNPDADYTLTSTPTIVDGYTGQLLYITCSNGEANTVTVQDQGSLAGSNLRLGAAGRAITSASVLCLMFDANDWIEVSFKA